MIIFVVFICSILLLSITLLLGCKSGDSDANTIITNPGENCDHEMNIMWHTDLSHKDTYLLYTVESDVNWSNAKKIKPILEECHVFDEAKTIDESGNILDQYPFYKATVYLKDLKENTNYMYKVGDKYLSRTHYFKTSGKTSFTIGVISDYHSYIRCPGRLKSAMDMVRTLEKHDKDIDFIYDLGDAIAWGGSHNFWTLCYDDDNFHKYMWACVNGNHDNMDKSNTLNNNQFFASTHAMPLNGYKGEEGVCYYFKYSDALFIAINNEDLNKDNVDIVMEWVQKVIDENRQRYLIFVEHYQWFNLLSGSCFQFNRWKDFFEKNRVDLALGANHHIYARSKNIFNGEVCENGKGTVYLQTASSDNERGQGTYITGDPKELDTTSDYQKEILEYYYTEGGPTVSGVILKFDSNGIQIEMLNRYGEVLDKGFVKKVE